MTFHHPIDEPSVPQEYGSVATAAAAAYLHDRHQWDTALNESINHFSHRG